MKSDLDLVEPFYDVEQRSEAWYKLRLGCLTATRFAAMARETEAKTRTLLMREMAVEVISGISPEHYTTKAMDRGIEMEADALAEYEKRTGFIVEAIGFVRRTIRTFAGDLVVGCSPDGLVGKEGLVQIKTMKPDNIIAMVESGTWPLEHRPQVQGEMWVTGRHWCDLPIFYRDFPLMPIFRFERDEAYIEILKESAEQFTHELGKLVARIRTKGGLE